MCFGPVCLESGDREVVDFVALDCKPRKSDFKVMWSTRCKRGQKKASKGARNGRYCLQQNLIKASFHTQGVDHFVLVAVESEAKANTATTNHSRCSCKSI